jgi:hypothetical protein
VARGAAPVGEEGRVAEATVVLNGGTVFANVPNDCVNC